SLGYGDQHYVHDHDGANDERDRRNKQNNQKDRSKNAVFKPRDRIGRQNTKIILLSEFEFALDSHQGTHFFNSVLKYLVGSRRDFKIRGPLARQAAKREPIGF